MARVRLSILFAGMLLVTAGQSILFTVLPPAGRGIGLAEWQVGLIITISGIAFAVASPYWGRVSDQRGRRGFIAAGLFGYALFTAAFAWALGIGMAGAVAPTMSLILLVFVRVGFGLTVAAAMPATQAYVVDTTSAAGRTGGLAQLSAAFGLGTVVGPLIAAALSGFGLLVPLYAVAALALMVATLVLVLLDRPPRAMAATVMLKPTDPRIRFWVLAALGFFMTMAIVLQTLGFLVPDRLVLDREAAGSAVGTCLLVSGLASVACQIVLARRRTMRPGRLMMLGLPMGIVGLVVLMLATTLPLLAAGMIGFGIAVGLCVPGFAAAASLEVEPNEQGAVAGIIGAAQAGGFILGPVLAGALYQVNSVLPYLGATLILVSLMAAQWRRRGVVAPGT